MNLKQKTITALVAIGVVAVGIGVAIYATSGPSAPANFQATGSLTIVEVDDTTCNGNYHGIGQGAQVVITGPNGDVVGVGKLEAPTVSIEDPRIGAPTCRFPFAVTVPAGKSNYGVAIAGRSPIQCTEETLRNGVSFSPTT